MKSITFSPVIEIVILVALAALVEPAAHADDRPAADSPLVKMLKSGRVPEARMSAIVDMIGKRGTAAGPRFSL